MIGVTIRHILYSPRNEPLAEIAGAPSGPRELSTPRALVAVSPYGTSWHLMALRDRTKFSE